MLTTALLRWMEGEGCLAPSAWLEACLSWLSEEHGPGPAAGFTEDRWRGLIREQWLHADLRQLATPSLPPDCATAGKIELRGTHCLQVMLAINVAQAYYHQIRRYEGTENSNSLVTANPNSQRETATETGPRLISLLLTDGVTSLRAMEYTNWGPGWEPSEVPVGCKVRLRGPVMVRRGVAFVKRENLERMGGVIDDLAAEVGNPANVLRLALATKLNIPVGQLPTWSKSAPIAPPPAPQPVNPVVSPPPSTSSPVDSTRAIPRPTTSPIGRRLPTGSTLSNAVKQSAPRQQTVPVPPREVKQTVWSSDEEDCKLLACVATSTPGFHDDEEENVDALLAHAVEAVEAEQERVTTGIKRVQSPVKNRREQSSAKRWEVPVSKFHPFCYIQDIYAEILLPDFASRRPTPQFTVRGFLVSLLSRLEHNAGSHWSLAARLTDGSATVDCSLDNALLATLIGLSAGECETMRRLSKSPGQLAVKSQLAAMLAGFQTKLTGLAGLFDLAVEPNGDKPVVVGFREVDSETVRLLTQRVNQ